MRAFPIAVLLVLAAGAARAGQVVVVAPDSPSAPYADALKGVCDGLGTCPTVMTAGDDLQIPADARVIIALGGRAARLRYPAGVALVTALSPGYEARTRRAEGPVVRVRLTLSPEKFVQRLIRLSPNAKSAALLWAEPASRRFAEAVRVAAGPLGLLVTPVRVVDAGVLPALLRGLAPADALFLAPDPALVTRTTFDAACEFSRSRGVAFYAPAPGLTARGGLSGLAPEFRAAGLRAAAAAADILARKPAPDEAYPEDGPADQIAVLIVSSKTRVDDQK